MIFELEKLNDYLALFFLFEINLILKQLISCNAYWTNLFTPIFLNDISHQLSNY